jgi:Arc/MetJ-type ribon-helix-helix transcriptional regulator
MSTSPQPSDDTALTQRLTVRIDQHRLDELEALVDSGSFPNQAEAVRTAIDDLLECEDDG